MQTLLDPFEAAAGPMALPPNLRVSAPPVRRVSSIEIELDVDVVEDRPTPTQPGSDSSGRLRCWCSEDD